MKGMELLLGLLWLLFWCGFSCGRARLRLYLSSWAVRVPGGAEEAQRLARRHGLLFLGQVIEGEPYYHLQHRGIAQQSLTQHRGWYVRLKREPCVHWFEQQTLKRRMKRTITVVPTDPWFQKQWYMNNDMVPDLSVLSAWSRGYTGMGVVVSILDDGIEKDHPDLVANYDPLASYDFNDNDPDPQPRYNAWDENRHGTRCAGEVAATANNGVCGAGIAYGAKIGGVRMLDGAVTDIVEAQSLSLYPQHIDIYSASWGPEDDGRTVDGPGTLAKEAFHKGVMRGRRGLGSVFVWASGNGGLRYDNCNCDGYTNSIYTLSVGSTTENGQVPWYNEACASTLTTTYSSGSKDEKQIVTTDLRHTCTDKHTGTSASAPLAAGMIALALEANGGFWDNGPNGKPGLGFIPASSRVELKLEALMAANIIGWEDGESPALSWRDMQHLVVRASKPAHLQADDWATNGVGRKVSHHYGYGLLDAGDLVDLAKKWATTRTQRKCSIRVVYKPLVISSVLAISKNVSACPRKKRMIYSLEHVQVQLSLSYSRRGDLAISLTSPMGTKSTLVALRPYDTSNEGYKDWSFMSTHYWDEDPRGVWTLLLENKGEPYNTGLLSSFVLKLYGTDEDMMARQAVSSVVSKCVRRNTDGTCQECTSPLYAFQRLCLSYCPPRYYSLFQLSLDPTAATHAIRTCAACHPSCYTCQGTASNCTACIPFSAYDELTHTCSHLAYSYQPRGGSLGQGLLKPFLLAMVILLCVGPILFGLLYVAYSCLSPSGGNRWWKQANPCAKSGIASLELVHLSHTSTKESLKGTIPEAFSMKQS